MRTTKTPTGESASIGIFRARGTPAAAHDAELGLPTPASLASPLPAGGRENTHVRFGSAAKAQAEKMTPGSGSRRTSWVASSPATPAGTGESADASKLILWHKFEDPVEGGNWTEEEWAAWELGEWEAWEAAQEEAWEEGEWDGAWESEYATEEWTEEWEEEEWEEEEWEEEDGAASPLNRHMRFPSTPDSAGESGAVLTLAT